MKTIIALLLSLLITSFAPAQIVIPRTNIQYGDSRCYSNSTMLWISLPDRGLSLYAELFSSTFYRGATEGWVIIGVNKIKWPIKIHTGQTCDLLTFPQIQVSVPMHGGWGRTKLFYIPMSNDLIGLQLYAQGGFQVLPGIEGFSRGVEFVIQ